MRGCNANASWKLYEFSMTSNMKEEKFFFAELKKKNSICCKSISSVLNNTFQLENVGIEDLDFIH